MSDVLITAALEARLFTVAGLPDTSHRALENMPYEPTPGEAWVRVTHRWGNETIRTLPYSGGRVDRFGLMQVDLFVPLVATTGAASLTTVLQAVKDAFPAGERFVLGGAVLDFHIREARRWGGRREGSWWTDHVDVRWDAVVTNPTF